MENYFLSINDRIILNGKRYIVLSVEHDLDSDEQSIDIYAEEIGKR